MPLASNRRSRQTRYPVAGNAAISPSNPRRIALVIMCTGPLVDAHISFDRPTRADFGDLIIPVGEFIKWEQNAPIETIYACGANNQATNIVLIETSEIK